MINAEAGKVLVEYSKHIARWAKLSERGDAPRAKRARNNAWRVLSALIEFAQHLSESDMYWLLLETAVAKGDSAPEQRRLRTIAKAEDRGYMKMKAELQDLVAELLAAEKANPTASVPLAKQSVRAAKNTPPVTKVTAKTPAKTKAARPIRLAPAKKAARPATHKK